MRIALLTREYLPETCWGGIGTFYTDFARALRDAGQEVEVFTQGIESDASSEVEGIRVHRSLPRWYGIGPRRGGPLAGMPDRHLGCFAWSMAREVSARFTMRHRQQPFDLLESHEHLGIASLLPHGLVTPRRVVRYHTAYHVLVDRGLEPWPRSRWIRRLEGRSIWRADLRIATTRFVARITREHFADVPDADCIIPLPSRFSARSASILEHKQPLIAFVGRLVERKQPLVAAAVLTRIAERFPRWTMEIAGADASMPGHASAWRACQDLLGPAARRCTYRGPLAEHEIADLYTRASIALVPSTFESFGLVALEAMSFGCVPVVSRGNALEEVVGDGGLTAQTGDAEAFAEELGRLIEKPDLREDLARRALERSRRRFDRRELIARNLDAFSRLLGNAR